MTLDEYLKVRPCDRAAVERHKIRMRRRKKGDKPPVSITEKPRELPRYTFMTEERATAPCRHSKNFYLGFSVAVCCACGYVYWSLDYFDTFDGYLAVAIGEALW